MVLYAWLRPSFYYITMYICNVHNVGVSYDTDFSHAMRNGMHMKNNKPNGEKWQLEEPYVYGLIPKTRYSLSCPYTLHTASTQYL